MKKIIVLLFLILVCSVLVYFGWHYFNEDEIDLEQPLTVAVIGFDVNEPSMSTNQKNTLEDKVIRALENHLIQEREIKLFERQRMKFLIEEKRNQALFSLPQLIEKQLIGESVFEEPIFSGVDFIVYGTIDEFSSKVQTNRFHNLTSSTLINRVGADVRISEVRTGEVILGSRISFNKDIELSPNDESAIEEQAMIDELAERLLAETISTIVPVRILAVEDNVIYLSKGALSNLVEGREYIIRRPFSLSSGSQRTIKKKVGTLKVTNTIEDISEAVQIDGQPAIPGDLIYQK